ncbi:MAG: adenylosuccinate lyase family protein [Clostridiales Family XIII bacterium]|jgi:adenylosuccinate lyase|nr:adenylosuccinate lyase family protein [Clostridiales Family XIII bacterium]
MMFEKPSLTMKGIFSQRSCFKRWLRIEAALAEAQAAVGLIPQKIADDIREKSDVEKLDLSRYDEMYAETGHPMVAFLRMIEPQMGGAGQYLHIGPTTHDIVDTGTVLALKAVYDLIYESLGRIEDGLLLLSEKYADAVMAARTHNVQAVPITFGFKTAIMAREIHRDLERLSESKKRVLTIQLSGAGGTMAAFGPKAPEIQRLTAEILGLNVPVIAWHAARDRLVEFTNLLMLTALALGRIGQEVYLLMATEVGEVFEPWKEGIVGSSCMPHKINPVISQNMMSLARKIRYNAFLTAETAMVDHEWNLEHFLSGREKLEEACIYMGELLEHSENIVKNMVVNPDRMRENLDILNGLMQSESVMIALGNKIGKMRAHEIVNEDATRALRGGRAFATVLAEDDRVNRHLTGNEIKNLLDPANHIGLAPEFAREVVKRSRADKGGENDGI